MADVKTKDEIGPPRGRPSKVRPGTLYMSPHSQLPGGVAASNIRRPSPRNRHVRRCAQSIQSFEQISPATLWPRMADFGTGWVVEDTIAELRLPPVV